MKKPGGLCSATGCRAIANDVIAPSAGEWLDSPTHSTTTSGGYLQIAGREEGSEVSLNKVRIMAASGDDACDVSCAAIDEYA